jgi:stearoyl-CoA desaturase (Delta-9 desaturase)
LFSDFSFDGVLSFLDTGLLNWSWWQIVLFTLATTHITIAGVTIYLHRHQAHRALDLHPLVSHFFRAWLWLGTGMVTKEWAAIHRKHHAKCETAEDPHSPQTWGIRKVLLEGAELYRVEAANTETISKYGHGTPDDWIERKLYTPYSQLGIFLTLAINVALFGVIGITVFAIQMIWIPVTAAGIINGLGHYRGYRSFDSPDASTNLLPWGIIIGGEELHNNHHAYPTSARLSNKWYEFDIGWMYIRIFEMLGLARVKKIAPVAKLVAARPSIDLEAVQAVIHHRYDVMASYTRSLRKACAEEAHRLMSANHSGAGAVAGAKSWLHENAAQWSAEQRAKLGEVMAASEALRKLVEMRDELNLLWGKSNATREQLVQQLTQWCARAEASGVRALQDMALRLRSYSAATPA